MREPLGRLGLVVVFVALTAGMLDGLGAEPPAPSEDQGPSTVARPVTGPEPAPCTPAPLERRAGQVLVVGMPAGTKASSSLVGELVDVGAGGVLIRSRNVESAQQLRRLIDGIRQRAGRPLVVAMDEESGRVSSLRPVLGPMPSPRRLAAESSPAAVRRFATELGTKLAGFGVNLDLAPVADLDAGPAGGIVGDRSFSAEPEEATSYALAYARGLAAAGVRPVAKHFPGHGRTRLDTHVTLPRVNVSLDELMDTDVRPFSVLVRAGVPAVMVNHVAYSTLDSLPASLAPAAYRLLRSVGFEGVAITDSVDMGAIRPRWSLPEAAVRAVSAGADGVLSADGSKVRAMRDALVEGVRSGRLDERRLDEAAGRMAALAGDDPVALACRDVSLPQMQDG